MALIGSVSFTPDYIEELQSWKEHAVERFVCALKELIDNGLDPFDIYWYATHKDHEGFIKSMCRAIKMDVKELDAEI